MGRSAVAFARPAKANASSSSACFRLNKSSATTHIIRGSQTKARTASGVVHAVTSAASEEIATAKGADVVRTVLEVSHGGTLSTICAEDQYPIGTYVRYILDEDGQPVFKLRPTATHTGNLKVDSRCSLYVRPHGVSKSLTARATLVGKVAPIDNTSEAGQALMQQYMDTFSVGEEEVEFVRLEVSKVLYVANMCDAAVHVSIADYREAIADPLCKDAPSIIEFWNANNQDELIRTIIKKQEGTMNEYDVEMVSLLWVDQFGADTEVLMTSGARRSVRISFPRPVKDERAARSALTMMGQVAWEVEKDYQPVPLPLNEDEVTEPEE